MSLPTQTQVLIVGAGPTGMACALTLVGCGLQVTLVDAFPNNRNGSRSIVIHARTLEVLNTIGLARPLLEAGIQSKGTTIHGGTNKLMEISIEQLRDLTEFPVVLLIPQHDVERVFREKLAELGVEILRPHTVVGIKEIPSGGGLEVAFEDGSIVRSRVVVGADGSRSTIRRLANIDFKDPATGIDYDGKMPPSSSFQIVLADVYLKDPLHPSIPRGSISFHLSKFFFMCPLRSEEDSQATGLSFWRIGLGFPCMGTSPPRNPERAWLQGELNNRCPWEIPLNLASVVTASRYRVRAAVASTFFKKMGGGNVLLVGDAAHVHSPVGGQGMNLGLCDAVALGQAIHAHIDANSKDDPESDANLDMYSASRRRIALRVVSMTGGLTTLLNAGTGWRKLLLHTVCWIVGRTPFVGRAIAWRLSGLANRDA